MYVSVIVHEESGESRISGGIQMHKLDTANDAAKLLGFAKLFFGEENADVAMTLVEQVLTRAVESAATSPIPPGAERTLKLFRDAHDVLEKKELLRPKKMSRAAWRDATANPSTGLQAIPAAQRETIILVKCIGFSYNEAAKIRNGPRGTVRSQINRASHVLAKEFGLVQTA